MINNKKILVVIPARAGSKRIPKKNIKRLGSKPLIAHTIEQAKRSKYIDTVVVSSDGKDILAVAQDYGAIALERPHNLAEDKSLTLPVVQHVADHFNNEHALIILLQPTSPFRTVKDIDAAIEQFEKEELSSLQSVCQAEGTHTLFTLGANNQAAFLDKNSFFNKEQRELHYQLNGAIYIVDKETLKDGLYAEKNNVFLMTKENSLDIDTFTDWAVAEYQFKANKKREPLTIANKQIGPEQDVFFIAEAGINHNGDIALAKQLIDVAKDAGADVVKFQTFNPLTGTSKHAQKVAYQKENEQDKDNYRQMLEKVCFGEKEFRELKAYADEKNIIFMSTASDGESLQIINNIAVPAYKIGSGHITNLPLLKETAKSQKPIIFSVGMSTYEEVDEAIACIRSVGNNKIVILHCVSAYPTPDIQANVAMVKTLQEAYPDILVGYSDHTLGYEAVLSSVALGACVIEKHITLDRTLPGPDHKASIEPDELKQLISSIKRVKTQLGSGIKQVTPEEAKLQKQVRRSIFSHQRIPKGTIITAQMLRMKKPEIGIKPKYYWDVIGKKAACDIEEDDPVTWDTIE